MCYDMAGYLPRISLNLGSNSMWYFSMYSKSSSVPSTLAIRTSFEEMDIDERQRGEGRQREKGCYYLIVVIVSVKERLLAEDERGEHAAETPHVERVVVVLVVDEQLGALEVTRRYSHVVLLAWVVELGQTPIDQSQLLIIQHS